MTMFKNARKSVLFATLGMNALFLLLYIVLGSCQFASRDDFFMSAVLTGAYGSEYDVHLFFVNAVYGCFLKPFYSVFPSVGWYYVFEVAEVFASFSVITYVMISRLGLKNGGLLSFLFLSSLSPIFYFSVEFTKNAALLTATGILLLSLGNLKKRKFLVLGVLFAVAGFIMRKESFYLGIPCLGMLLLYKWIRYRKFPLINFVAVLGCACLVAVSFQFDKSLYQDDEYKYYAEYQGPRSVFGDGRYYDYDAALDEIDERGLHGLDFLLLTNWTYYDTEILSKDSLYKFMDVLNRNHHEIVLSKMPIAVLKEISRCLHEINVWFWVLLGIAIVLLTRTPACFAPWASFCYVVAAYIYLMLLNRIVSHVEVSIWLYASTFLIPFLSSDDFEKVQLTINTRKIVIVFAVMLYAIGFWNSPDVMKSSVFRDPEDERWVEFMRYENANKDKLFFMDLASYKWYSTLLKSSYKALEPGRLDRIIPLGYWNVHLPGMKMVLRQRGVENPLKSITNPDVIAVQYGKSDEYEKFLKMHYGYDVSSRELSWTTVYGRDFVWFELRKYFLNEENLER